MKKLILMAVWAVYSFTASAQKADNVKYCEVVTASKAWSTTVNNVMTENYFFDFGNGELYTPQHPPKDAQGKNIEFNSSADMLNWLGNKGYELVNSFSFAFGERSMAGERWLTHYSFKKVIHK